MIEFKTSIDARDYMDNIILPMVIRKRKIENEIKFTGFVPGFSAQDIIKDDLEQCKKILFERTKEKVSKMLEDNSPLPFFPTKEELMEDFNDIVHITFIKVPNTKKI